MKNSTPLAGWSFWAWGIGHGAWERTYQCPMPNAPSDGATIPLQTPGDGVSRRFQLKKYPITLRAGDKFY